MFVHILLLTGYLIICLYSVNTTFTGTAVPHHCRYHVLYTLKVPGVLKKLKQIYGRVPRSQRHNHEQQNFGANVPETNSIVLSVSVVF